MDCLAKSISICAVVPPGERATWWSRCGQRCPVRISQVDNVKSLGGMFGIFWNQVMGDEMETLLC